MRKYIQWRMDRVGGQDWVSLDTYHNSSGAHWDNTNGVNIQGTAAAAVFDTYVSQKVHYMFYFI